jgi:hypothetical protein
MGCGANLTHDFQQFDQLINICYEIDFLMFWLWNLMQITPLRKTLLYKYNRRSEDNLFIL